MSTDAFIFDTLRTPRGRGKVGGGLSEVPAIDLVTHLLQTLEARTGLDTAHVDDVLLGCVTPIGEQGADIARTAVLNAGWHVDVPGVQVNRFCASGLESINLAAAKVRSGWEDLLVAGGVESMSRVPIGSDGGALMEDPRVSAKIGYVPQGISADLIATVEGFSRQDLDSVALLSQERAHLATEEQRFAGSLVPVVDATGRVLLDYDEHIRPQTTLEALGTLKPAFAGMGEAGYDAVALNAYPEAGAIHHVHTAGNSSGIVDGAAVVVVGSKEKGAALGLRPRARVVASALIGTEPTIMLVGPGPAAIKALGKAGMSLKDIDLLEVNEAFAAVVLRFLRDVGLDTMETVNVNGGAIALGHPLGATGAILLMTALDELERRDLSTALVTLCVGGGMGIATVIERV